MSDSFFFNYGKYIILLTAIVGLLYWHKLKKMQAHYLPIFLLLVFAGECVGQYYIYYNYTISEKLYYYFLLPAQILFYLWIVAFKALRSPKTGYIIMALFLTVFLLEVIITKNYKDYVISKSYSLGGILLSILVLLYVLQLAKSKFVLTFFWDIFFWVCMGISIYYTLSFPFYSFYNTLLYKYEGIFIVYRNVTSHLSFLMYLILIVGFICSKKT